MIAGPIKRFQVFVPALHEGLKNQSSTDVMHGLVRIAVGCSKKWAADNLTGWIDFTDPHSTWSARNLRGRRHASAVLDSVHCFCVQAAKAGQPSAMAAPRQALVATAHMEAGRTPIRASWRDTG
jgi:hypothetical protein